jgi:ABC-type phosphate transport system substrate-binding protein
MKTMKTTSLLLALLSAALVVGSRDASAQTVKPPPGTNCLDGAAGRGNVVYVTGSSALRPFLTALAPVVAADNPSYTIIYQSQGSCAGVAAVYDVDPAKRVIKDVPAAGTKPANYAIFFKSDGAAQECFLDTTGAGEVGTAWPNVDLGISDVFSKSCAYETPPAGITIADYFGPIQPMTFVVPSASSQRSISAEAAYLAFGLGGGGKAAPWIDPSLFFVRNSGSGTQQMLARAIGVPADKWWGLDRGGSAQVRSGLKVILDKETAEKSIGIVSVDIADEERSNLRILAFKAKGQSCGYLPDSTPNTRDKINVRDGHYPIWGPVHLFARTSGGIPNAAAGAFVGRFATARVDKTLLDAEITKGLVPQCAMRVARSEEMGPLASFQPQFECGCYFDFKANGATKCKACGGPAECGGATPACNFGYCEAR